ncbi:hypothetical protein ACQ4PT_069219 [Festuca glaucescens]
MGSLDYYEILNVDRSATDDDLRRAYGRLAMRWHPDKNPAGKSDAEAKFKDITEAYNVLSDATKRAVYDQYGEEGLKDPPPQPGGSVDDIFAEFFGSTPFTYSNNTRAKQQQTAWDGGFGRPYDQGVGADLSAQWNQLPADLVFVVDERPHDVYRRDRNDLLAEARVTLAEALGGTVVVLAALDGRELAVDVGGGEEEEEDAPVVCPGYELVVPMEGMPIAREPGRHGSLRIRFDVAFPDRLTRAARS